MNKYNITWIDILSLILFLLGVYFILTRIFGHSATDITITITLFGTLGILLYKLNREFGEFKIKTMHNFNLLKSEIGALKSDVATLKSRLDTIDGRLSRIELKLESIGMKLDKVI